MLKNFIKKRVLNHFLRVELTSIESAAAEKSVSNKYSPVLKKAIFHSLFFILPILFLEVDVIITVLIPITMVAGTAWFSISLANMKQKFERFGLELTGNLFEAFGVSLGLILVMSVFSLSRLWWEPYILVIPYQTVFQIFSFLIGFYVMGNIIYKIFVGSIKYDINDAMLTGQNEAAEKFYRKSLSVLHSLSKSLRDNKSSLEVANYYIGVAFFEIFSFINGIEGLDVSFEHLIEDANHIIKNPSMSQKEVDRISLKFVKTFAQLCINPTNFEAHKSLQAIHDEVKCLEKNPDESQEMVDTRMAVIFQEIADLLEGQGETLFLKPKN